MSELRDTNAETQAEAEKRGCIIIRPEVNQLFVDIDNEVDLARYNDMVRLLGEFIPIREVKLTRSPSLEPFHYHAVITLDLVMDDCQRIALQACLGSDRTRELLSMRRLIKGSDAYPTVFFEKKDDSEAAVETEKPEVLW